MEYSETLHLPELELFEQNRAAAYDELNVTERDLQAYGDIVDFTGESVVERHNAARRKVGELTLKGINAGYLPKLLKEDELCRES